LLSILITTASQGIQFLWLAVSSRAELGAEVLFLRKQLAFYEEHEVQPRKLTYAARLPLALWSQLFNWRAALVVVKPETLVGASQGVRAGWAVEVAVGTTGGLHTNIGWRRSPREIERTICGLQLQNHFSLP
jgi:putative transposase